MYGNTKKEYKYTALVFAMKTSTYLQIWPFRVLYCIFFCDLCISLVLIKAMTHCFQSLFKCPTIFQFNLIESNCLYFSVQKDSSSGDLHIASYVFKISAQVRKCNEMRNLRDKNKSCLKVAAIVRKPKISLSHFVEIFCV